VTGLLSYEVAAVDALLLLPPDDDEVAG